MPTFTARAFAYTPAQTPVQTPARKPVLLHARSAVMTLLLSAAASLPALAADATTDALQAAYAPYRAALSATNGKSAPDAATAVGAAAAAWDKLASQLRPPMAPPYDRDPAFADTLQRVQAVYANADRQVMAGQLPQAHEALEAVRELLADLRRRNGVVVFSDHMNAYHAQMERLLGEGPRALEKGDGWLALAGHAGVLDYLAQRLRSEAPAALAKQAEFEPLLNAVLASSAQLRQAVQRQDAAAARDALGKLKSPYSRLFVKFG